MATVTEMFKGAVDAAFRKGLEDNKEYKAMKRKLEADAEYVGTVGKVAAVLGYTSTTLATLGLGCCATGHEKVGIALICFNVPLSILALNASKASENFRTQVFEAPMKLMVLITVDQKIIVNPVELRKCLLNGTVFFEPLVGVYGRKCLSNSLGHD